MDQELNQEILEAITGKGWNLYYRGKADAKISVEETYERGPVKDLEKEVLYIILPRVEKPNDRDMVQAFIEKHQVEPKIILPQKGFPYFGKKLEECAGEDNEEFNLGPGRKILFTKIEFRDEEIRLFSLDGWLPPGIKTTTFLPYDVFLEALDNLQDISELEPCF